MIPLIRYCIDALGCEIVVAANGKQKALISEIYPKIRFLSPPDYDINYHKNRTATKFGLIASAPRILSAVYRERRWVNALVIQERFDYIISDNRYGFYHNTVPSIIITHQLSIYTGFGKWADKLLQCRIYRMISRFNECWIPDLPQYPGLAGRLSHPEVFPPVATVYIGPMTRLEQVTPTGRLDLLVILSGPEPQRTLLEQAVMAQWQPQASKKMVLVRGLPGEPNDKMAETRGVSLKNHASPMELSQLAANAAVILCRSGYSSLMDLLPLKKQLILVPTPGQPEQEYLGKLHADTPRIRVVRQEDFDLNALLRSFEKQE
ncbi:putative glycosyltransferase [Flavihumibacter petaseus NBRC 106054]|uniref:Putative glycosyltransferase n=1 Tax=Flavihumibacter petaseus NBRC 106054 TaxID=1220578 RepID=A0A0E9MYF7_9BACT|nr:putative glycosyltransferase [Flavihumibacter petaseus NBRC 106054]